MKRICCLSAVFLTALALPVAALASETPHRLNGADLSIVWIVPFVCLLLSIALGPVVIPHFWHRHYGKIALFWGAAFLVPCAAVHGLSSAIHQGVDAILHEYLPFIIMLLALYTVAGGIRIKGQFAGTPLSNTGILAAGTLLASWMGTTGAAMLLVRPLLKANSHRLHKVHSIVFFIFLVANIGGSLTPLGDPPLFLGFLSGISFFWTTSHLALPAGILSATLLTLYLVTDLVLFAREGRPKPIEVDPEPFGIDGKINLFLLVLIAGSVLLSGVWNPRMEYHQCCLSIPLQNIVRDVLLLLIAGASMLFTTRECRELNGFSWDPVLEVAKLFIGIFISMIPAIAILRAGEAGALGVIAAVTSNNHPVDAMYFWCTGILSSLLDNAPTYLVFFNAAGGDPVRLMGEWASTLTAISAGAVFMGALTYIGNAPNFMIRSIAREQHVAMPSFFGYMLWSVGILFPLFGMITWLFFC